MKRYIPVVLCIFILAISYLTIAPALPLLETILSDIWDSTNNEIRVQVSNGFLNAPFSNVAAASYTLASTSKASEFIVNYTDTAAMGFTISSAVIAVSGRVITIKDGELNANTNNIVIGTAGSETIDEAATFTLDADGESVRLMSDGSNLFVMGSYLE